VRVTWDSSSPAGSEYLVSAVSIPDNPGDPVIRMRDYTTTTRPFTVAEVVANTRYRITVRGKAGSLLSPPSNELIVRTLPNPGELQATPVTANKVRLRAFNPNPNELNYHLDRQVGANEWLRITSGTLAADPVELDVVDLEPSTEYTFRLILFNETGFARVNATDKARTLPIPPTNFTATSVSGTEIRLNWEDVSPDETGFQIYRQTGDLPYELVATAPANSSTYLDGNLERDTRYIYYLRTKNVSGVSRNTPKVAATTRDLPPLLPAAPSGLALAIDGSRLILTWTDNSGNEDRESGFGIQRDAGSGFVPLAFVGANVTQYTDAALTAGVTYRYRVFAFNASGKSGYSNTAQGRLGAVPPSNLTVEVVSSTALRLRWQDNSSQEQSYELHRWNARTRLWTISDLPGGITTYVDSGLEPNTRYVYQLFARSHTNLGASNKAEGTTLP
jgi:fibronectin type 3 domain-containing protein